MYNTKTPNKRYLNMSITKFILIFFISLMIAGGTAVAQSNGSISGKITDKSTNEELISANVLIVGTTTGASSDLDGSYIIRSLAPGKYSIRVSYTSYQTTVVNNIVVEAGKDIRMNIQLEPATAQLNEVVV